MSFSEAPFKFTEDDIGHSASLVPPTPVSNECWIKSDDLAKQQHVLVLHASVESYHVCKSTCVNRQCIADNNIIEPAAEAYQVQHNKKQWIKES